MSRTDLIADVFTMIRNAFMVHKESVDVLASKTVKAIVKILKDEGYIDNFKLIEDKKQGKIRVYLRYISNKSAIRGIKRISRPGLRVYVKKDKLPYVLRGKGLAVISTSRGLMVDNSARKAGLGGEVIAHIW